MDKAQRHMGRRDFPVWTIDGRARLARRSWHSADEESIAPIDAWLDAAEDTISLGVREMVSRLDGGGKNLDRAAANLARAARITSRGETSRVPALGWQTDETQHSAVGASSGGRGFRRPWEFRPG